jgi:hypothetical protein
VRALMPSRLLLAATMVYVGPYHCGAARQGSDHEPGTRVVDRQQEPQADREREREEHVEEHTRPLRGLAHFRSPHRDANDSNPAEAAVPAARHPPAATTPQPPVAAAVRPVHPPLTMPTMPTLAQDRSRRDLARVSW